MNHITLSIIACFTLLSPATMLAMDENNNNNNNRHIQQSEGSRLLPVEEEKDLEYFANCCCYPGIVYQKYQQIKETREVHHQLSLAAKKRQLATVLMGVTNKQPIMLLPPTITTPPTTDNAVPVDINENRDCNPGPLCTWFWCGPCLAFDKCCAVSCAEACYLDNNPLNIKGMEERKQFIEHAASLGFHEDPTKRRESDKPWMTYPERYIRISNAAANNK